MSERKKNYGENDLFDPCDPYMTFEVKPSITFVAVHPYILLTKFGRNRTKNVEEVADCQKSEERK